MNQGGQQRSQKRVNISWKTWESGAMGTDIWWLGNCWVFAYHFVGGENQCLIGPHFPGRVWHPLYSITVTLQALKLLQVRFKFSKSRAT